MQGARIVVPNSRDIESKVYKLANGGLDNALFPPASSGMRTPTRHSTVVRRLVRALNKEYGIKLNGKEIEHQTAFGIACTVQGHLFRLQRVQEPNGTTTAAKALAKSRVLRVIADALNKEYDLNWTSANLRGKTVDQLCDVVLHVQEIRNGQK